MKRLMILLLLLGAGPAVASVAAPTPDQILASVGFDQHLNDTLPLNLPLREGGKPVQLAKLFGHTPVILVLAWYSCPNICSIEFINLASTLKQTGLQPGKGFQVVTVSIDPHDGPAQAKKVRQQMLAHFGPALAAGLHVLTAPTATVKRLAKTIGYRYTYDRKIRQYAHPTGLVVLTERGRISRYLFGISYSHDTLRKALVQAGKGRVGSVVEYILTCCYAFNPQTGKYTLRILTVIKVIGVGFLALLAGLVIFLFHGDRRSPTAKGESA